MKTVSRLAAITSVVLVTACAAQPYVYDGSKYNRGAVNFGQDATDIDSVIICYSSSQSDPAAVIKLAMDACGEFDKTAVFESQDYLVCPLVAPVAARYNCELPSSASDGTSFFTY
jgi:hypothetical protein